MREGEKQRATGKRIVLNRMRCRERGWVQVRSAEGKVQGKCRGCGGSSGLTVPHVQHNALRVEWERPISGSRAFALALPGVPELPHGELFDRGDQAAEVIRVGVREDDDVEAIPSTLAVCWSILCRQWVVNLRTIVRS